MELALCIVLNLVLMSFILFLRSGISGLGQYRTDSLLSVLDKLLMILLCGALLLTVSDFTIYHFVYAQMVSLSLTAIIAFGLLRKHQVVRIYRIGVDQLRSLIRQAGPYALAVFLMSIYTRVDGVMIEQLADDGPYQAGLYAAGYRLLDAANMFAFLFAVLLLPMFSKLMEDRKALFELIAQSLRLMLTLTISISIICFFFRQPVMQLLYAESTRQWGSVFGLLILSFNGIGLMYVLGTTMTAKGDLRRLNLLYACFALLNIGMNAALIPSYGAWGAAIATLVTQSLVAVALLVAVRHSVHWRWPVRYWLRCVLFASGVVLIAYGASVLMTSFVWIACFVLAAAAVVIYAFLVRMVYLDELMALFKRSRTPD
ncbi:MAG: oligosaccharide flippase family protein, partial [Saprospiraceae bacterium]|nr:oligosaccharide flippase family protein [Saprospiraceae bacterium]